MSVETPLSDLLSVAAFEHSSLGMAVLDQDGKVLKRNGAALDMTGLENDGVLWMGSCWTDAESVRIAFRKAFAAIRNGFTMQRALCGARSGNMEVTFVTLGTDTLLAEFRTLADNDNLGRQLHESEEKFQALFEHAPFSMTISTLDGEYLAVNRAFCKAKGLTADEAIGMSHRDVTLVPEAEGKSVREALLRDGYVRNLEASIWRADTSEGHVLFSAALVTIGGRLCVLSS